ncbi:MAG TPA: sulfate adenylyltransferase subunit CysD [Kofleriaceae bacterium]|nr:sulfate adenylyltransferase subunit CysD [Kofleriaceae bacterium]
MAELSASHASQTPGAHPHHSHLDLLEAEAIAILRETAAELSNPVLMYSIGKDSQVLLHLARKAFYPAPLPFPLLHVDTGWKFREMYQFRDAVVAELGVRLIVHRNQRALDEGINPFDYSSQVYTHATKTQALLEALKLHGFDAALGGARRDEERSRAKERVFSFRDAQGQWDPRRQRPELWDVYNGRVRAGESIRVFPMSNWTELDVWLYILRERIPVVPLYFAASRPVVARSGTWIMADDERMRLRPGEAPEQRRVRFRTLGCYPLSGAIESEATTVSELITEMLTSRRSERAGRLIDFDEDGSMESKKREGYF